MSSEDGQMMFDDLNILSLSNEQLVEERGRMALEFSIYCRRSQIDPGVWSSGTGTVTPDWMAQPLNCCLRLTAMTVVQEEWRARGILTQHILSNFKCALQMEVS